MVNDSSVSTDINGNVHPPSDQNGNVTATEGEVVSNGANGHGGCNGVNRDPEAKEANEGNEAVEERVNTYTNLDVCFLCGEPATIVCDKCGLVAFCSEKHQKLHRPENFCFPFMVEQREGVGRFVVAVRDIEPLELVMWDNAACLGPRMGCPPCCLQCLKKTDGQFFCSECGWPMCGEQCAKGKTHAIECELLKKTKDMVEFNNFEEPHDYYRSIAPLRLLRVKQKCPEVWERLGYLMDHNEDRIKDTELWENYQTYVNKFLKAADPSLEDEDINRAVGLLWTNAFACSNGGGQAIFPTFSFMSHSCVPNCSHSVFPNKTLALQAKHAIKAGEEFTIAYISPLQGSIKRRMKLHDKWYFDCGCARCQSPTELDSFTSVHLCQKCCTEDAHILPTEVARDGADWRCKKCGDLTEAQELNKKETDIATAMQGLDNFKVQEFEKYHDSLVPLLHPNHYLMVLLKRHMVGLYSTVLPDLATQDLERVKKYCEEIDSVYQKIDPGYQKERGTILRALCEVSKILAKKYLNENKETEEQFSERVKICIDMFQEGQKCMFVRLKKGSQ